MLTIIHGDDIAKSREYYLQERAKHSEKIILDGLSLTLTDFLQANSGNGLFQEQQAIFIEDLLTKRKPSKELEAIQSTINNQQSTITLYESKKLTPKQLSLFKKSLVKEFKIQATVFAFLDAFLPKNSKELLMLFHQLLQTEDVNFALFMLQRQVRILLTMHTTNKQTTTADSSQKAISEISRLAPWQKGKLQKQANAFSLPQLLAHHEQLYKCELAQKTGTLAQPLEQAIDFFLLAI